MTLPQQPTEIAKERQALAPYNFVTLPEQVATLDVAELPDQDIFHATRHSGWIDCQSDYRFTDLCTHWRDGRAGRKGA